MARRVGWLWDRPRGHGATAPAGEWWAEPTLRDRPGPGRLREALSGQFGVNLDFVMHIALASFPSFRAGWLWSCLRDHGGSAPGRGTAEGTTFPRSVRRKR